MNMHQSQRDTPIYVTASGFQKLQQQLVNKQAEYAPVREHRQVAFELSGDGWHDNPEFNRMQQLEASLNHSVKQLTEQLDRVCLISIDDAARPCHQVGIGSIVSLRRWAHDSDSASDECWEIVGYDETNLPQQQLAYNAPLAMAVLGLRVDDVAEDLVIGTRCWDIEVLALYADRQQAALVTQAHSV